MREVREAREAREAREVSGVRVTLRGIPYHPCPVISAPPSITLAHHTEHVTHACHAHTLAHPLRSPTRSDKPSHWQYMAPGDTRRQDTGKARHGPSRAVSSRAGSSIKQGSVKHGTGTAARERQHEQGSHGNGSTGMAAREQFGGLRRRRGAPRTAGVTMPRACLHMRLLLQSRHTLHRVLYTPRAGLAKHRIQHCIASPLVRLCAGTPCS